MFKKLFNIIKNKFIVDDKTNFNQSIKMIKKLIAKSQFNLAIGGLNEILKKEEEFFAINSSKDNDLTNLFFKKKDKIEGLKNYIEDAKTKKELKLLINTINNDFRDKKFELIRNNLIKLRDNFINKDKKFKYLSSLYNKNLKKLKKIEAKTNTEDVNNFLELTKKIEDLISLGKFNIAEDGILEIKNKETKIFEAYKDNHEISRKKIKKIEYLYNKKIITLDKMLSKVFVLRNKHLQKKKQEELKKIFNTTKFELNNLMKSNDLYNTKYYIENKIKENTNNRDYIYILGFLNKNLKLIIGKIKNKESKENKQLNTVQEVNKLLSNVGEKINNEILDLDKELTENKLSIIFEKIKNKYKKIVDFFVSKNHKKALNELDYLLGTNNKSELDVIKKYHTGMTKFLSGTKINGYNFYGKVIGADKVTGDSFVMQEKKDRYWLSIGDATGHGFKAGLIVSKFTKLFLDLCNDFDKIEYFAMELNNKLKSSLKSGNFLTCLIFEIDKKHPSNIRIVGMGHEPLYIYRKDKKILEEFRFVGLAGGIRKILNIDNIKINNFVLNEGDVIISYTDGIIEAKNADGQMYSLPRFKQTFFDACNSFSNLNEIYDFILNDLKNFSGKINYDDDVTIILFGRNSKTDLVSFDQIESIVNSLDFKVNLQDIDKNKIVGKTKEEFFEELQKKNLKKELNLILLKLHDLYKDGEMIKLKDEAIRYIKKGYVSAKINKYLKNALEMEHVYKINVKNQKLMIKYKTLLSLYSKGDYKTVIKEAYDVITKNGNI